MTPPELHVPTTAERAVLVLLLVLVSIALAWILAPLYGTILWAGIIGLLFAPVQRRLLSFTGGRRSAAALLTLTLAVLIVIVPFLLVSATLAREAMAIYARAQSDQWDTTIWLHGLFDALPAPVLALLDRFALGDFAAVQRRLATEVAHGSEFIAGYALGIGQNTFVFMGHLFVTIYLAFFLIRDGERVLDAVRRALPLAPEHKTELLGKFATVLRATVKGTFVVAVVQGALGGVAFWVLGIGSATLGGVLMAFLSMVPAVGAAIVWLPVVLFLLLSGSTWQGVALLAYGTFVIGLADNLLRPMLVGRDTRLPDYVVMLTTLGGLAAFGLNGVVVGPAIAAMFVAVWHLNGLAQPHARLD
jgi:predicted PurR-regulated permease PerM